MTNIVTDPDLLSDLNGPQPAQNAIGPQIVTDPDEIHHLETQSSAAPSDAMAGPNGLMWNSRGGYDPKTGELVIAGKPFTQAAPNQGVAFTQGMLSGVPIVGPAIQSGVDKAIAGVRSMVSGGPVDQNTSEVQDLADRSAQEFPKTAVAGNVVGAVAGLAPVASTALGARALGLVGDTLPARVIQGAAGGAAIGGADSAARGGSPVSGAENGAGLGAIAPGLGSAIGAAGKGVLGLLPSGLTAPLSDLSSTARNMLGNAVQGETPQTIADAHAGLGPHAFVGDITPSMSSLTKSVADQPDAAAGAVRQAYQARSASDGGRIDSAITDALGPSQDLTALTKSETAARSSAADPLYNAWRNTPVPPTDDIRALMPRLNAAGVSGGAANKMAIEGVPGANQWFKTDPITGQMTLDTESSPTAQTFDYMKQSLDDKIGAAINSGERGQARLYQGLKSDLVDAIDNHPDPNVAGVWKSARQAWSDPTSIMTARQDGATALSRGTGVDELREQFQNYSPPEQQSFIEGLRGNLTNTFGATKNGDTLVKNQLLAPNSQAKLQYLIGPDKTKDLITSLQQEDALAQKSNRITGGSPTHQNMQGSVLSGPAAIPGAVSGYVRNFALDRPGTWFGMSPGDMIGQHEASTLAQARSQIAPILTMPNGPNADLAQALLNMSAKNAAKNATAGQLRNMSTMLINGAGRQPARQLAN